MKPKKKSRQFDIDQLEALSRTNNLEVSSLLHKYESQGRNNSRKLSGRRQIMSDMKSRKMKLSPTYSPERGLVTTLTKKIDILNEEINDKNYTIRELTAEIFNWKNKFNDINFKFEKSQDKKKLLKQYLKEKVESLLEAEQSLDNANEAINDLSNKYELLNSDKDKLEDHYQKEFGTIVNTLSSMKVYDKDTIESDSLMEVIHRSLNEIQSENRQVKSLKLENSRLKEEKQELYKRVISKLNIFNVTIDEEYKGPL